MLALLCVRRGLKGNNSGSAGHVIHRGRFGSRLWKGEAQERSAAKSSSLFLMAKRALSLNLESDLEKIASVRFPSVLRLL